MFKNLRARLTMDKDTWLKWGFLIAAGVLGLVANIFDTRKKDRIFEETVNREVSEKIEKLTEGRN